LLLLALLWMGGYDFRAGMLFNVVAMGVLAFGLISLAGKLRGRTSWTDACFPLLLLGWGHSDNFLWGWQVGFGVSTLLAGFLRVFIATGSDWSIGRIIAIDFCLMSLPLCGGSGLPLAVPLALWLAFAATERWRSRGPYRRRDSLATAAGAAATLLI